MSVWVTSRDLFCSIQAQVNLAVSFSWSNQLVKKCLSKPENIYFQHSSFVRNDLNYLYKLCVYSCSVTLFSGEIHPQFGWNGPSISEHSDYSSREWEVLWIYIKWQKDLSTRFKIKLQIKKVGTSQNNTFSLAKQANKIAHIKEVEMLRGAHSIFNTWSCF